MIMGGRVKEDDPASFWGTRAFAISFRECELIPSGLGWNIDFFEKQIWEMFRGLKNGT